MRAYSSAYICNVLSSITFVRSKRGKLANSMPSCTSKPLSPHLPRPPYTPLSIDFISSSDEILRSTSPLRIIRTCQANSGNSLEQAIGYRQMQAIVQAYEGNEMDDIWQAIQITLSSLPCQLQLIRPMPHISFSHKVFCTGEGLRGWRVRRAYCENVLNQLRVPLWA